MSRLTTQSWLKAFKGDRRATRNQKHYNWGRLMHQNLVRQWNRQLRQSAKHEILSALEEGSDE